jgi:regulator of sirC expression with transglutaminase-like and TPR domain
VEPVRQFADVMNQAVPALDEALAYIAAALEPGIDVIEVLSQLDDLAASCPSPTVDGVMRHLFQGPDAFRGDVVDYDDPSNSLLHRVVERRRGLPITLSVVAIEVARRLGVPLVGVGMPSHFLVGEPDALGALPLRWFDCFEGAPSLDIDGCRALYHRVSGGDARFDLGWLAPTSNRFIVLRVLTNLKGVAQRRGLVSMLRTVLQLRAHLPEVAQAERVELMRLMAPFN